MCVRMLDIHELILVLRDIYLEMKEVASNNKGNCSAFTEDGNDNTNNLKSKHLQSEIHLQKPISQNLLYSLCQAIFFFLY